MHQAGYPDFFFRRHVQCSEQWKCVCENLLITVWIIPPNISRDLGGIVFADFSSAKPGGILGRPRTNVTAIHQLVASPTDNSFPVQPQQCRKSGLQTSSEDRTKCAGLFKTVMALSNPPLPLFNFPFTWMISSVLSPGFNLFPPVRHYWAHRSSC